MIALETDTLRHKKAILIAAGVNFAISFIFSVLYFYRWGDVLTAEDNKEAIEAGYGFKTKPDDAFVYNQMCLELGQNYESGEYMDLVDEIAGQIRDEDDIRNGTYWSQIYMFNGVTLLLISLNSILMAAGAKYYYPRLIALILNLLLSGIHFFGCVITTAVFRFRPLGKLCALSIQPTKKEDVTWTY